MEARDQEAIIGSLVATTSIHVTAATTTQKHATMKSEAKASHGTHLKCSFYQHEKEVSCFYSVI